MAKKGDAKHYQTAGNVTFADPVSNQEVMDFLLKKNHEEFIDIVEAAIARRSKARQEICRSLLYTYELKKEQQRRHVIRELITLGVIFPAPPSVVVSPDLHSPV